MKLKLKLGTLIIAIMVVVLTGISVLLVHEMSDISRDLSIQNMRYIAEDQATYWEGQESEHLQILHTIADIMAKYEDTPAEARRDRYDEILRGVIDANPDIVNLYTVWKPNSIDGRDAQYIGRTGSTPTGQYAITYTRESGKTRSRTTIDVDASMAYINGPNSKKDRVEHPFHRAIEGKDVYLLRLMVPIINPRTNETVGGVGCLLNISMVQSVVQKTLAEHKSLSALTIFSGDGLILGHKVPERVGKKLTEAETIFGKHIDAANAAVNEGREFSLNTYSPVLKSNVELLILPFPIGNSNKTWSVMVVITENIIFAPIRSITQYTAIIAVVALIVSALIILVVLSHVVTPIVKVANSLKDISEGEGDLTQTITVNSKDEVGDLARYFNKLMKALREPISDVKKNISVLASVSEELSTVSKQLASGSEETVAQSSNVASTTEQMAMNITAMASGAEEASVNANEVAGAAEEMSTNMNTIAAAIEQMSASISEISGNASEALRVAEEASAKSGEATSTMNKLGIKAKEIGKVTDVIKQIADKTNLLALNATIEAASAGEAGKGFAVVASEIKELANQSARNADDIASRIGGIQQETSEAVDVIRDVSDIIVKINNSVDAIAGHVDQQTKASNEIANNVAQANLGARRVAGAISEIAKGANDVSRHAGEAAKGATEVSKNVTGVSQVTKASLEEASRVSNSATDLSKMAEHLKVAMDKFKV